MTTSGKRAPGRQFRHNDGGRAAAGYRGSARDSVARAIAIAAQRPYAEVYAALAAGVGAQRQRKTDGARRPASARNGVNVRQTWFRNYMQTLGFHWTATMSIGSGTTTHLRADELPPGRLVVAVSRHYTAVIDGVIHDTNDPSRNGSRAVYGYWSFQPTHERTLPRST